MSMAAKQTKPTDKLAYLLPLRLTSYSLLTTIDTLLQFYLNTDQLIQPNVTQTYLIN